MPIDSHIADSILLSIRHRLGLIDDDDYDQDLIMDINSALSELNDLGVGTKDFTIKDDQEKWSDFLGAAKNLEQAKTFVYLKVKLLFDPPTVGILVDSINKQLAEITWRLYVKKDNETGGKTK